MSYTGFSHGVFVLHRCIAIQPADEHATTDGLDVLVHIVVYLYQCLRNSSQSWTRIVKTHLHLNATATNGCNLDQ